MSWIVLAFMLVGVCIVGKYLIVSEIRRQEQVLRDKQQKLFEENNRAKLAQQKSLVAQKTLGLAERKLATLKYRLSNLEKQITDVEVQEIEEDLGRQRQIEVVLEKVVRTALLEAGFKDEAQVLKVMGAISSLIDLEKQGSGDELIAEIRDKLQELKEKGEMELVGESQNEEGISETPEGEALEKVGETESQEEQSLEPESKGEASVDTPPMEGETPVQRSRPNPLQTRQVQQRSLLLLQVLQILLFDHLKLYPPDPLDITFQNRDS